MIDLAKVKDIALTEEGGELVAHLPDCPMVQKHRKQGKFIATFMGMQVPLKADEIRLHECLTGPKQ